MEHELWRWKIRYGINDDAFNDFQNILSRFGQGQTVPGDTSNALPVGSFTDAAYLNENPVDPNYLIEAPLVAASQVQVPPMFPGPLPMEVALVNGDFSSENYNHILSGHDSLLGEGLLDQDRAFNQSVISNSYIYANPPEEDAQVALNMGADIRGHSRRNGRFAPYPVFVPPKYVERNGTPCIKCWVGKRKV